MVGRAGAGEPCHRRLRVAVEVSESLAKAQVPGFGRTLRAGDQVKNFPTAGRIAVRSNTRRIPDLQQQPVLLPFLLDDESFVPHVAVRLQYRHLRSRSRWSGELGDA